MWTDLSPFIPIYKACIRQQGHETSHSEVAARDTGSSGSQKLMYSWPLYQCTQLVWLYAFKYGQK